MRAEARGESGTLMACTPSCASSMRALDLLRAVDAARRHNLNQRDEVALFASSAPMRERCPSGAGGVSVVKRPAPLRLLSTRACASMARMAERMARMWLGVVPQQPPTICAPAAMALRAKLAMIFRRAEVDVASLDGARHARHWAWPPGAAWWPRAWLRWRSAPSSGRWSSSRRWRPRPTPSAEPQPAAARSRRGSCFRRPPSPSPAPAGPGAVSRAATQRLVRLVQRGHGFNNQQSTPASARARNLLGKSRAGLFQAGLAQRLQTHAQRAHASRPPRLRRPAFPSDD